MYKGLDEAEAPSVEVSWIRVLLIPSILQCFQVYFEAIKPPTAIAFEHQPMFESKFVFHKAHDFDCT